MRILYISLFLSFLIIFFYNILFFNFLGDKNNSGLKDFIFGNLNLLTGQFYMGPFSWLTVPVFLYLVLKFKKNSNKINFLILFLTFNIFILSFIKVNFRYPFGIYPIILILIFLFIFKNSDKIQSNNFLLIGSIVVLNLFSAFNELIFFPKNNSMLPAKSKSIEANVENGKKYTEAGLFGINNIIDNYLSIYIRSVPKKMMNYIQEYPRENDTYLAINWYPLAYYHLDNIKIKRMLALSESIAYLSLNNYDNINVVSKFEKYKLCGNISNYQKLFSEFKEIKEYCNSDINLNILIPLDSFRNLCEKYEIEETCQFLSSYISYKDSSKYPKDFIVEGHNDEFKEYLIKQEKIHNFFIYKPYLSYSSIFEDYIQKNCKPIVEDKEYLFCTINWVKNDQQ